MGSWAKVRCMCDGETCTHKNKELFGYWPEGFVRLGDALDRAFPYQPQVFPMTRDLRHIGDHREVNPELAAKWKQEIELLERWIDEESTIDLNSPTFRQKQDLNRVIARCSSEPELYGTLKEVITAIKKLCSAAQETNHAIELSR